MSKYYIYIRYIDVYCTYIAILHTKCVLSAVGREEVGPDNVQEVFKDCR